MTVNNCVNWGFGSKSHGLLLPRQIEENGRKFHVRWCLGGEWKQTLLLRKSEMIPLEWT